MADSKLNLASKWIHNWYIAACTAAAAAAAKEIKGHRMRATVCWSCLFRLQHVFMIKLTSKCDLKCRRWLEQAKNVEKMPPFTCLLEYLIQFCFTVYEPIEFYLCELFRTDAIEMKFVLIYCTKLSTSCVTHVCVCREKKCFEIWILNVQNGV